MLDEDLPQIITDWKLALGNQKVNGRSPKPRQVKGNQQARSRRREIGDLRSNLKTNKN